MYWEKWGTNWRYLERRAFASRVHIHILDDGLALAVYVLCTYDGHAWPDVVLKYQEPCGMAVPAYMCL